MAALSLLLPSTPTYDPWTWMGWGRDLASLSLDTRAGPAFKPLPVFVGALLSPLGDLAPWLWLVIARAGGLLAAVLAFRLAWRLAGGSLVAGSVAFAGVLLCGGWVWNGWLGNSEGIFLALVLVAAEQALDGRHRWALALGFVATLLRLEAAPFLLAYGCWVGWRDPGARAWIAAAFAALPVAWLGPDLAGSGDVFRSSERARIPNPGAPTLADRPALESLERALALAPAVIWAGAALALVGVARRALPRLAALPLAAGAAWVALVALMSELGYSGEERYAMPGIALAAVSAGAGADWAARSVIGARRLAPALVASVLVAIAAAEQAGVLAGRRAVGQPRGAGLQLRRRRGRGRGRAGRRCCAAGRYTPPATRARRSRGASTSRCASSRTPPPAAERSSGAAPARAWRGRGCEGWVARDPGPCSRAALLREP